jgi:hypothetical protein
MSGFGKSQVLVERPHSGRFAVLRLRAIKAAANFERLVRSQCQIELYETSAA